MAELRDLEADRRHVEACRKSEDRDPPESVRYFSAGDVEELLDEIDRLKGLIVKEANDPISNPGWYVNIGGERFDHPYPTEAAAWAAVRKAAMK